TLNSLACTAPVWLENHLQAEWPDRYGKRFENWQFPKSQAEQQALAEQIGRDGYQLLEFLDESSTETGLRNVPAVEVLRQVWQQQFIRVKGQIRQRPVKDMPPEHTWLRSPYDTEARYCTKRNTNWVGYCTHFTETCDEHAPRLITHVKTTVATEQDSEVTQSIQADLVKRDLKPEVHIVDTGYMDAANLVYSQHEFGIDLLGPMRPHTSWQTKDPMAFDILQFNLDWDTQTAICPTGQQSSRWINSRSSHGAPVIRVQFAANICTACPVKARCTHGAKRGLTLRPQLEHEALHNAPLRETTDTFKQRYHRRAGIEGTLSQGVRRSGLRHSRYIGLAKTHLHCISTAVALNVIRAVNWLNDVPLATTRKAQFLSLVA
nr:transposase [Anaerolineae bacterium]